MTKPENARKTAVRFHKDLTISYWSPRFECWIHRVHYSRIPRDIINLMSDFDYQRFLNIKGFKGRKNGAKEKATEAAGGI
jgi:hypothetical protein